MQNSHWFQFLKYLVFLLSYDINTAFEACVFSDVL